MKAHFARLWQKRSVRYIGEILVIVIVIYAIRLYTQKDLVSGQVPEIQAPLLNGQIFSLQQFPQRPLLIHFWAEWCSICSLEQGSIESISQDYPVISIAMQSGDNANVTRHMQEQGLSFTVINDPTGSISQQFGVKAVPTSFIIDHDNKIVFRETGYTSETGLRFRMWMAGFGGNSGS